MNCIDDDVLVFSVVVAVVVVFSVAGVVNVLLLDVVFNTNFFFLVKFIGTCVIVVVDSCVVVVSAGKTSGKLQEFLKRENTHQTI